jgi:hypothetical protein
LGVAAVKAIEYAYQLPVLKDELRDSASMEMVTMSTAIFCAFCWIAPKMEWKQKI